MGTVGPSLMSMYNLVNSSGVYLISNDFVVLNEKKTNNCESDPLKIPKANQYLSYFPIITKNLNISNWIGNKK